MTSAFVGRTGTAPEEGIKAPVVVATQVNITLSGEQTIDSVAVVAADRVLVQAQTDTTENGVYDVKTGAWTRSTDFNEANDVVPGILIVASNDTFIYQAVFTGLWNPGVTPITFVIHPVSDNIVQVYESVAQASLVSLPLNRSVYTKAYHAGWAATIDGPQGGSRYEVVTKATHDTVRGYSTVDEIGDFTLPNANILLMTDGKTVERFGATGTGITNDTAAFVAFYDKIKDHDKITHAPRKYLLSCDQIGVSKNNLYFDVGGAEFVTNDTSGVLFDLNDTAISGDDNSASGVERKITVVGGKFVNTNGATFASNNTCTAIKAWAVRGFTVRDARFGSGDGGGTGGWFKAIDASCFNDVLITNNYFYGNDFFVYVDDVYPDTVAQNYVISHNHIGKCFNTAIYIDTAISDFSVLYNHTAQPEISTGVYPTFCRFVSGSAIGGKSTRGIKIIGNNSEQHQGIMGQLILVESDGVRRADDIRIKDNILVGDNNNISLHRCGDMVSIKGNNFFTTKARAIYMTDFFGDLVIEENIFKQLASEGGVLAEVEFTANAHGRWWGKNRTDDGDIGAVLWSHTDTQELQDSFHKSDGPVMFTNRFNGGGSNTEGVDIRSKQFTGAEGTADTTEQHVTPLSDVNEPALWGKDQSEGLYTSVYIQVRVRDSGSAAAAAGDATLLVYPRGWKTGVSDFEPISIDLVGVANDEWVQSNVVRIPLGTNNQFSIISTETGGGTGDVEVSYFGYGGL